MMAPIKALRPIGVKPLLVGAIAGLLGGLLGVGGGTILVPALQRVAGMKSHEAHATSLAVITLIASSGLIAYAVTGQVPWRLVLPLSMGGALGSYLGARVMIRLPVRLLRLAFGVALMVISAMMLTG